MSNTLLLLFSPFILQIAITFFDELYFHRKRGLPLWEVIGHPLDTLTVLACYAFIMIQAPTAANFNIYIGLAIFSCLFITKDEFVHHENSGAIEQWLHSVLFILHPLVLIVLGLSWFSPESTIFITSADSLILKTFIDYQFLMTILFLTYQTLYWSIPWKKFFQRKQASTMITTTISAKIG
jgi:hypothetical protein